MIRGIVGMLQGAQGKFHLDENQLRMLEKLVDKKTYPEAAEAISKFLATTKAPNVDVALKSMENYSIAGIRLNSGDSTLGNCALSVVNPTAPTLKTKMRIGSSQGSAFIDASKLEEKIPTNVYSNASKKENKISVAARYDDAFGVHISANKADIDLLKKYLPNEYAEDVTQGLSDLANNIIEFFKELKGVLK